MYEVMQIAVTGKLLVYVLCRYELCSRNVHRV